MRSSTTPPDSSQHRVYWAEPGAMRRTSLVRQRLTKSAAPGPVTDALPSWLRSKTPTRSRTAVCSATTPPPGYSIGMSQPPKSAILAPRATWRSFRGEVSGVGVPDVAVVMGVNLPPTGYAACARYHRTPPPAAASWVRPEHHSRAAFPTAHPGSSPAHPPARPDPPSGRAEAGGRGSTSTKESFVATLTISTRAPADTPGDALVIPLVAADGRGALAPGHGLPRKTVSHLTSVIDDLELAGKAGEVTTLAAVPEVAAR